MTDFSFIKLFSGVYKILKSSPSAFIFGFLGILFLISMVISIKRSKKIEKPLFIIGWVFVSLFVIFRFFTSLNTMLDNFVNNVFMQIFFPNLATYFIIVVVSNIILLVTFFSKKTKLNDKIVNTVFYLLIMILLLITLEQISKGKINIYEKLSVYKNQNLITLIEGSTLVFTFWMMIILSKMIIRKLVKKSGEIFKNEDFVKPVDPIYPEEIKPVEPLDSEGNPYVQEVFSDSLEDDSDMTEQNDNTFFEEDKIVKQTDEKISEKNESVSTKTESPISKPEEIEILSLDDE